MNLTLNDILTIIADEGITYWILEMQSGYNRNISLGMFSTDGNTEEAVDALNRKLQPYLAGGSQAIFYITMKEKQKSQHQQGPIPFTLSAASSTPAAAQNQFSGLGMIQSLQQFNDLGFVPKQTLDANVEIANAKMQLVLEKNNLEFERKLFAEEQARYKEAREKKENELREMERSFNSDTDRFGAIATKALGKLLGIEAPDGLGATVKTPEEPVTAVQQKIIDLGHVIHDNFSISEINQLEEIIMFTKDNKPFIVNILNALKPKEDVL